MSIINLDADIAEVEGYLNEGEYTNAINKLTATVKKNFANVKDLDARITAIENRLDADESALTSHSNTLSIHESRIKRLKDLERMANDGTLEDRIW